MRADPHYRTFRVDKLILSALEATLRVFLTPKTLPQTHRVMQLLTRPEEAVRKQAEALSAALCATSLGVSAVVAPTESQIGGGSLSGHTLPSYGVLLLAPGMAADTLASRLRRADPPVFTRVHQDRVVLDLRTVLPGEEELIVGALTNALSMSSEARP